MNTQPLQAAIGADFTLIGTDLHAMYEKRTDGYAVLLIPSEQTNTEGITIQKLIDDIKSLVKGVSGQETSDGDFTALTDSMNGLAAQSQEPKGGKSKGIDITSIRIVLRTAYLYINKSESPDATLEYAFNLEILAKDLLPEDLKAINVSKISIAVWNTSREKILNQMSIAKVNDYLGIEESAVPNTETISVKTEIPTT